LQGRLADALTKKSVRPIGAQHSFKIDLRVIATSNMPLADLVAAGKFDKNLLSALSGTRIALPLLRDRASDIPSLTRHFLARIGEQPGLRELGITDAALKLLAGYDWPGNVRQLQAVLFRSAVFCDGDALTSDDFPQLREMAGEDEADHVPTPMQDGVGVQLYTADGNLRPLEEIEADVIRLAIGHYRGRMTEVARRLGIGRSTLYRKLGDLGIENAA
jgi:DNA-binding NtrC family response regulator